MVFFVEGGLASSSQMRRIAWELEHHDVHVVVAPSISEVTGDRVRIIPVGGLPLIHVAPPRAVDAARWGKRLLDILGSAFLLFLAMPVLFFAAARIKLHDGGPVLFWQTRAGRDGRELSSPSCVRWWSMPKHSCRVCMPRPATPTGCSSPRRPAGDRSGELGYVDSPWMSCLSYSTSFAAR